MSRIVDFARFLYGKCGIKKQKNSITPQKRGITTQKRGTNTHNFGGDSMNSSLKWLKFGRKWAFWAYFDADSGGGGCCAESSVAGFEAFWVNIVITLSPLFWGRVDDEVAETGARCSLDYLTWRLMPGLHQSSVISLTPTGT